MICPCCTNGSMADGTTCTCCGGTGEVNDEPNPNTPDEDPDTEPLEEAPPDPWEIPC
jgi:hypothetical protein